MKFRTDITYETDRPSRFRHRRYPVAGLVLLCAVLIAYVGIGVFKDFGLVKEALPSLPAAFTNDLDSAILFSPLMARMDRLGNGFLRCIKYPPLSLPYAPDSVRDPIGDAIRKAQREEVDQGGALPLDDLLHLKQSSIEAVGRAIYLSQEGPAATQSFEKSDLVAIANPAFGQEPPVEQVRQIFEIAYGHQALEEAMRPERRTE